MGRLNPALYRGPATSSSSSFNTPPLGSVHLSYTWIGEHYDQLKIRILKVKNILEEYSRAGLYFRWEQSGNFNLMSTFNDQLSSLFVHILVNISDLFQTPVRVSHGAVAHLPVQHAVRRGQKILQR